MNTKTLIGSLVGGLLVFIWQFMSWALINIHESEQKYTEKQDSIIQFLSQQGLEDATYMVPRPAPGASQQEQEAFMTSTTGKPWAMISYRNTQSHDMVMPMVRGLIVDIVAVFLLCWLLGKIPSITMSQAILVSVCIAIIGYLTTEYTQSIWYKYSTAAHLIDAIGCWTLCGAWLGWWINRK